MSQSELIIVFSIHPSTTFAALRYGQTCSGVSSFYKELPTFATDDDVKPHDHTIDVILKSSLETFHENGQTPEFSNPAKIFFMINETGCAEVIIHVRSWILIFFPPRNVHHPVILCNSIFCFKRPHDSNMKRLQAIYAVQWKSDKEYFPKMGKK